MRAVDVVLVVALAAFVAVGLLIGPLAGMVGLLGGATGLLIRAVLRRTKRAEHHQAELIRHDVHTPSARNSTARGRCGSVRSKALEVAAALSAFVAEADSRRMIDG
ncbi:MAG: hypothetical protein ACYDHH_14715 [Solirubrobacteraceae bacterium]